MNAQTRDQTLDVDYPRIRALFTKSGVQSVDDVIEIVAAICEQYTRGQIIDVLRDSDPNGRYADIALTDTEIAINVAICAGLLEE